MNDTDTVTVRNLTLATKAGKPVRVLSNVTDADIADILQTYGDDDVLDVILDTVVTTVTTVSTDYLTPCPYDHAHTRHWCGHVQCRDS